ncbi:hypothetical protein NDU88_004702 [Pleurodeles waltl]|uniref:Uncharacterized protein n=1 Tax=Pleurodeles waltl TaxID=8319 RepID=A0AAV7RM18_PLEWA|nr:hypothetical protein NDU88_004702 [Pleurodeles waltl]
MLGNTLCDLVVTGWGKPAELCTVEAVEHQGEVKDWVDTLAEAPRRNNSSRKCYKSKSGETIFMPLKEEQVRWTLGWN